MALDGRDLVAAGQRGMVRYLVGLARHLPAHGVRVALFHRAREPLNPAHLVGLDCEVVGLADRSGVHWEQVVVPLVLARERYHLYHAPAERGVPLAAGVPVALSVHSATNASYKDLVARGMLPGPPSRYLGYDPDRGKWGWRLYGRLQAARADHVFTPSAFAKDELVRLCKYPASRVTVTPLAMPDAFRRPADSISAESTLARHNMRRPYLLFVGGYESHKNPAGVLAAFALARQTRTDLTLVIVGTGPVPPALVASAAELRLRVGRDVTFLSDLTDDLVDIYDQAAAFVSLSWRESFGVPYLEAMARGVPVVASRWGAAPEVVGDAGELVDPRDTAAAAAAILRAVDPADRPARAARGRQQASKFDWGRTAAQTAAVYRGLLARRTTRPDGDTPNAY